MIRRTAPESQGRYGFGAYLRRRGALFRKNRKFPLAKPGEVVYNIIVARSGHADIAQQVERILGKDEVASSNLAISSTALAEMQVLFLVLWTE